MAQSDDVSDEQRLSGARTNKTAGMIIEHRETLQEACNARFGDEV